MRARRATYFSQVGFTLIEVVLALTIFALMATILYGAFFLGHRAVDKSRGSFERNQRLRSFGDLLGNYIRSSYPYRASLQDPTFYYEGEADHLNFVSSYSFAMGGRGMAKVSISWDGTDKHDGIVKLEEVVPVRLNDEGGESGQHNSIILQEGAREFRIAYLNPQTEEEAWEERWSGQEQKTLPRAVRLSYRTAGGKEVRWVIPVMMSVLAQ
jgi:prepilin-type N-terminal cleavage/methylation domain-containing protein